MGNVFDIVKQLLKAFFDAFFSIFTEGFANWLNFSRYIDMVKQATGKADTGQLIIVIVI